jgi:hypothetical protein
MTRHMGFVIIMAAVIGLFGLPMANRAGASEHQWTSLDGPYWTNGIDVAYGKGGGSQTWHRYLIGSDASTKKLFRWRETDSKWFESMPLPGANRIASYKGPTGNGDNALCTSYNDRVWITENGGLSWDGILGSEALPNKQFATVEIDEGSAGSRCFVGSMAMANEASVYEGVVSGQNWDWSAVGDGLEDLDVKDLEFPLNIWLVAGTDDGIWRIQPGSTNWERANVDFAGVDVTGCDELGYHAEMWAATGVVNGYRRLYYSGTDSFYPWDTYQEVQPEDVPFDKEVNDIAAIYLIMGNPYQSIYIAAKDGLYLLDMDGTNSDASVREYISFQEDTQYFENSPFRYDHPVISVDYYQSSWNDPTRYILVGTEYNIYLITETRSGEDRRLDEITIEEIVSRGWRTSSSANKGWCMRTYTSHITRQCCVLSNSPSIYLDINL